MKKIFIRVLAVLAVAAMAWYGYRFFNQLPQRQQEVASTRVLQGDVVIRAFTRGELRAVRSATIMAPNLFGTTQVTRLAPMGSLAREKDLIVEFDDSERRATLEETLLEVDQIDEQIKQKQAELAIRNNQDQVDLLRARYSVRRSELEVKRNPLLAEIDRKKNLLNLDEAQRSLKQLESDIKSRQEQARAELDVLYQNRNRSLIDVNREKRRIAQTRLLAPITGLVAIRQNRMQGRMFGQELPDIREGDNLMPGMPVADVLDLSELELVAKVGELDRANLHDGQDAVIQLDAIPGERFQGRIKSMSGTASANVWSGDPAKKFDVIFSIDMSALLKKLGAKPEQIQRIMETAARNAKRAPVNQTASLFGGEGPGGMPGMGTPGQAGGAARMQLFTMPGAGGEAGPGGSGRAAEGGQSAEGGRGGEGRRRAGNFGGMSEQDRQKFREAMQKELGGRNPQDLSPEERRKVFEKLRQSMGMPARQAGGRTEGAQAGAPGAPGTGPAAQMGRMPGGRADTAVPAEFEMSQAGIFGTEEERAKARLPLPPEEDSQLDVLLRPGLLADIEIIVERIPNAIHIPNQAVFEKDGRLIAYVKTGKRFQARTIEILKRSESTVVIKSGLRPNEMVALSDPNVRTDQKKKEEKKGGGGGPLPGVGGNSKGGR
ncbi:MAG: efflux RND transporter periplasmic adaptor subunit [Bryobacterales bacterium]|nr:efflux RND transporter periplasmic adaptor subunit [Bryobacterales bacterium]